MSGRWVVLGAVLLGGCMTAAGPPMPVAPPAAGAALARLPTASTEQPPDDWWRLYGDAQLDQLVQASLAANVDLRVAYANLDRARAASRQARAVRLPQPVLESSLGVDRPSTQPTASSVPATDYDIAAAVSWDIDLFGRLRAGLLAAQADAEAQAAALDGLRVAIVADTVLAYVDLCGARQAATTARGIVSAQERSARVVEAQLRAGEASPLESAQAGTLYEGARATVPPFEAARDNALYRLATLQGLPPGELGAGEIDCPASPRLPATPPAGDGIALLLRRPDVRQAERQLAAAAARVGVARADLYPQVNLGGAIGLLSGGSVATASPLVTWAFPNQGPARARIAQAEATERAALAAWEATVLRALREVETALAAYDAEVRRNQALTAATAQASLYALQAVARVRVGEAPPLLGIDAERALASTSLQKVQSDLAMAQLEVALFRALGGGWQGAPTPVAALLPAP